MLSTLYSYASSVLITPTGFNRRLLALRCRALLVILKINEKIELILKIINNNVAIQSQLKLKLIKN